MPKLNEREANGDRAMCSHGVELVDAVIGVVEREGLDVLGGRGRRRAAKPVPVPPERLASLAFPDGKPLSPALRRWLAFDASWLGWFDDPEHPVFRPLKLGALAKAEFGADWGFSRAEEFFPADCYALPFGADSRRALYAGEADARGEYPILVLDIDDAPYIGIDYPGIDAYLAEAAGILARPAGGYGAFLRDEAYGPRMRPHADRWFFGRAGSELENLGQEPPAMIPDEGAALEASARALNAGRPREARDCLEAYEAEGGPMTAKILANLCCACQRDVEADAATLSRLVSTVRERLRLESDLRQRALIENFLGLTSSRGFNGETVELVEFLDQAGIKLSQSCWVNYQYAASLMDAGTKQRVADAMDARIKANEGFFRALPASISNMVYAYADLGLMEDALRYARLCAKHKSPMIAKLRKDPDLKALHALKEFQELFR